MSAKKLFFILLLMSFGMSEAQAQKLYICKDGKYTTKDIVNGLEIDLTSDCDSITFSQPQGLTENVFNDTITITYYGTYATVSALPLDGSIDVSIDGADVSVTNSITDREICTVLSGLSTSGSFVYNGNYKTTIRLNGLTLTGSAEEAVNIKCGKRVALELADGTVNTLSDCTIDNGQKAAFHTKGHLEVSGGGTLNLVGNAKHALSSKEYMLVKKTTGTINVTSASKDGIHAGQYFKMNGGTLTVKGVKDDAVQVEATGEAGEESDGQMIINGGVLDLNITADDASALNADSLITITDGTITIVSSGNGSKGIKTDSNVNILGGTFNITNSGGTYEDVETDEEDSDTPAASYRVYVTLPATTNTGGYGGPGGGMNSNAWTNVYLYKSDGTLVASLTNSVTISTGSQSATFYYYDFKSADNGTYYFMSDAYTEQGGMGRWGGSSTSYTIKSATFTGPTNGSDYYYTISSSYSTSGTTRTYSLSNTTSTWSSGTVTAAGADLSSSHGIKANNVTIDGGSLTLKLTGTAGKAVSADNELTVNGGTLNITNSGEGLASGTESFTAKGLTSDGAMTLAAGDITINMSGKGGKGIKTDAALVVGKSSDSTGPTLNVTTTGATLSTGTSTGGNNQPGGFGGMQESSGSSSKAIKAQGTVTVYGGAITVGTSTDGAEGLESKTGIDIRGGQHYFKCYDDCINSSGNIVFNGGVTVCYSNGNDAVDSNAGKTGAVTIGNGTVFAFTTAGSPEEGLDCDNNSYIQITGTGIAISAGGAQGGGSSSSSISNAAQGYAFVTSSISYTSGRYYTLADSNGNNLVTYSFPASCSSSLSLFTAKGMTKNGSYTVKYSTTAPTDATTSFHGLYLGSTDKGTTSVTSFTAK